jgi:hypothetical protein
VVVAERSAIPGGIKIVAKRGCTEPGGIARRFAIEAHEIEQHPPEPRAEHVARLHKQAGQSGPGIFKPAFVERHGKRHVGRFCNDPEMSK